MKFNIEQWNNGKLLVNSEFASILKSNQITSAEQLWNFAGESVKKQRKERGTERAILRVPEKGTTYETYIKRYRPLPFREYIKTLTSFRPIIINGAFHEWKAILAFHEKSLPTMIPIAVGATNHGTCNMMLGIQNYIRASELFEQFSVEQSKFFKRKRELILKISDLARRMHAAGFGHQDFYLVHIFVKEKENDSLYLIDLQRLIMQKKIAKRWIIKDLAQLYYSAAPFVSKTDMIFFWKNYSKGTSADKNLIKSILAKGKSIKRHAEKILYSSK